MNGIRVFAGLAFLAILTVGATPGGTSESGEAATARPAAIASPGAPGIEAPSRAPLAETTPFAAGPVDEGRREASSLGFGEFSGGAPGALIIGAALAAAAAILLAVVFPW